jgi:S-formylglutathione hydrolase FrmB
MSHRSDEGGRVSRRALLLGGAGAAVVLGGGAAAIDHELGRHPGLRDRIFGCGSTPPLPASHYTITTGTFASAAMKGEVPWEFAIPTAIIDRTGPTTRVPLVVVLPGEYGQPGALATQVGLPGWATAAKLNASFAAPGDVGSTYYHPRTNGTNSYAMVTQEFIPMIEKRFGVGGARTRRAIYGWSMGGFGALLVAQLRPDLVCAAVGASPAVFSSYHAAITGHPDTFDSETDWALWGLWNHLAVMGKVPVRIDCGNGDPFAATAKQLLKRIPGAVGQISSGCHDEGFWRRSATTQLQFLAAHLRVGVD